MPWTEATCVALIVLIVALVWATVNWAEVEEEDRGLVVGVVVLSAISAFLFILYWAVMWRLYNGAML